MLKRYFEIERRGTSVRVEIVAGVTTFLTMAYIIFVNPAILSLEGIEVSGVERMDRQGLVAATCLAAGIGTLAVGFIANAPIAMAPGMGLNAFFAALLLSGRMTWQTALGVVFLSGAFFLALTLLGLRKRLVAAIPSSLISAIAVGIGLFITFMGLVSLGVVVADEHTLVRAGPLTSTLLIGLTGLLVMIVFAMLKIAGGLLAGIVAATIVAALAGKVALPPQFVTTHVPLGRVALQLDILGALQWGFAGSIFTLMFIDMFDSVGTLVACTHQAGLVDEQGRIERLDRLLGIDAAATMMGALAGTSTTTAYIESAAGIEQGGRTGLASVITGILFFLAIPLAPVVGIVPAYATAPALIMVGLFMMREVKKIDFDKLEEGFPAFVIVVTIALSYSISTGLAFGFLSFAILKVLAGKVREVSLAMWVIAGLSLIFLIVEYVPGASAGLREWLSGGAAGMTQG